MQYLWRYIVCYIDFNFRSIEEQIESQELKNVYEKVNIIRKLLKKNMNNQPDERK